MAITKERKEEVLATYADWMKRSQAVILVEYTGAKMKDLDRSEEARAAKALHGGVADQRLAFGHQGISFRGAIVRRESASVQRLAR